MVPNIFSADDSGMAVATTGVRVYGFPVRLLLVVELGLTVVSFFAAYDGVLRLRCGFMPRVYSCVRVRLAGWLERA